MSLSVSAPELVSSTVDNNPQTTIYWPRDLGEAVSRVLAGEYRYPPMPDEPSVRRVLDIGAGVGAFAVWAYRQWHRPWIDSYEPHPDSADVYEKNAPPGAKVHRLAVSPTRGKTLMFEGVDWAQNSLVAGASALLAGKTFEVDTIDPAALRPADVIKIDTQGTEHEVLRLYPHLDAAKIVIFRWHGGERAGMERTCERVGLTLVRLVMDRPTSGIEIWVRTAAKFNVNKGIYELEETP